LQIILNLLTLLNLLINILSNKLFSCIKSFHNKNKNLRFQTQRVPPLTFFCPGMLRTKVGHRIYSLFLAHIPPKIANKSIHMKVFILFIFYVWEEKFLSLTFILFLKDKTLLKKVLASIYFSFFEVNF
jgi:hypothetical protein